ncbi:MAG TPA: hypothetical protein VLM37_00185, partial [Fibrobacteraceae bacterium]|nr:hypothetical protein [Fibrobacteraceae bacterium]
MSLLSLLLSLIAGLFFFSCTDHSDVVDPNDRQDIASWNSSEKGPSADVLSSSSNLEENASSIFSSSSSSVSILSSLAPSSSVEVSSSSASLSSSLSQSSSVALNSSVTASSSLSAETNASSSSVEKDQSSSAASKKDVVWDATDAVGQLQGGIYDGYWYSYTDSGDAGNSIVVPANPFSSTDSASYDWIGTYITDSCGGASLCAVMTFGNAIDYPYVGIGVNFLDPQAEVDVSSKYV